MHFWQMSLGSLGAQVFGVPTAPPSPGSHYSGTGPAPPSPLPAAPAACEPAVPLPAWAPAVPAPAVPEPLAPALLLLSSSSVLVVTTHAEAMNALTTPAT